MFSQALRQAFACADFGAVAAMLKLTSSFLTNFTHLLLVFSSSIIMDNLVTYKNEKLPRT